MLWFTASLIVTGIAVLRLGWSLAVAMLITVSVHEYGHWLVWRLAAVPARFFASPFLGFCLPKLGENENPLTTMGYGVMYLAGSFACLALSTVVMLLRLTVPVAGQYELTETLFELPLFLNLLNMGVLLPVTDGGRCFMLLASRGRRWYRGMVGCAGLIQGAVVCTATGFMVGVVWVVASIVVLVITLGEKQPMLIADNFFRPWVLFVLWAGLFCASAGLLTSSEFGRYLMRSVLEKAICW